MRIAAVEQLRAYAKVINVPLSIVSDKVELDRAISSYADYDVIVIDTGGCSQRDETQMFELRDIFDERGRLHNILVLSATTKDSDTNEITRKFGSMPLDSIVFTSWMRARPMAAFSITPFVSKTCLLFDHGAECS